ncbi:MAG: ribbon-helix-helix domain-containing protein [Beijerinckiaceae bacterium]
MSIQSFANSTAPEADGDRHTKFRILKIGGRKRAFSLEPVFWNILEEAAKQASLRLGDYVANLLAEAPNGNNSSLLRSKAAEWAAMQAERLRDKGLIGLARRIAISHASPAFVIDQYRHLVACNKPFEDLITAAPGRTPASCMAGLDLRLGVPMAELARILREHPEKFLRANFAARWSDLERSGALNIMLVGDEKDRVLFLCLVRSIDEARRGG